MSLTDHCGMPASKSSDDPTFGFLHVTELVGGTLMGGLLLLNPRGRPLEFHCTEPLKPNRAQQILFGATLTPYLYGEQIGQSLVRHSSLKPVLLITDQRPVLAVRTLVEIPTVWLPATSDMGRSVPEGYLPLELSSHTVWLDETHAVDRELILRRAGQALPGWDLAEPFQRIQEAISELHKAA
jgi:hypothetical protein